MPKNNEDKETVGDIQEASNCWTKERDVRDEVRRREPNVIELSLSGTSSSVKRSYVTKRDPGAEK